MSVTALLGTSFTCTLSIDGGNKALNLTVTNTVTQQVQSFTAADAVYGIPIFREGNVVTTEETDTYTKVGIATEISSADAEEISERLGVRYDFYISKRLPVITVFNHVPPLRQLV